MPYPPPQALANDDVLVAWTTSFETSPSEKNHDDDVVVVAIMISNGSSSSSLLTTMSIVNVARMWLWKMIPISSMKNKSSPDQWLPPMVIDILSFPFPLTVVGDCGGLIDVVAAAAAAAAFAIPVVGY